MAPWLFLLVALVGAGFTASSLLRVRRAWYFTFPYFMGAWLTGELALHHIAWQAVATLVFAAFGALGAWPGLLGLAITFASWGGLLYAHGHALRAYQVTRDTLAEHDLLPEGGVELRRLANPFRMRHPDVEQIRNLPYGDSLAGDKGRRNLLDITRPREPGKGRPVLLQIHGGGWVFGDKEQQGQPLMHHLASRGWVCFASNYRLSPQATFPDQIVDVKRAIAWIREHAEEFGADPDFICITGGSAGGHLAALAALSPNDPAYQPGFEEADTRLSGCVPFYGVYDFLDRQGIRRGAEMTPFLEGRVLKVSPEANRELWENASPITRVSADAPPFLVIHGSHDSLVFVEEARHFVSSLREKSRNPVVYLELPGAQHAFDTFHSVRSSHAVHAVTSFLEQTRADYLERIRG
jgi:acetyl esterase/lipase